MKPLSPSRKRESDFANDNPAAGAEWLLSQPPRVFLEVYMEAGQDLLETYRDLLFGQVNDKRRERGESVMEVRDVSIAHDCIERLREELDRHRGAVVPAPNSNFAGVGVKFASAGESGVSWSAPTPAANSVKFTATEIVLKLKAGEITKAEASELLANRKGASPSPSPTRALSLSEIAGKLKAGKITKAEADRLNATAKGHKPAPCVSVRH